MLRRGRTRKSDERVNLLTNAIDIRAIPFIFNSWMKSIDEEYTLNNFERKWKAVVRDAGIDTKRFYVEMELQRVKYTCVTVAGLYYFCFYFYLRYINEPSTLALEKLYEKTRELNDLSDFGMYFVDRGCILFEKARVLHESPELRGRYFDTSEINKVLYRLIDEELLFVREDDGRFFWTTEGVETLCYVTRQLLQFLPSTI